TGGLRPTGPPIAVARGGPFAPLRSAGRACVAPFLLDRGASPRRTPHRPPSRGPFVPLRSAGRARPAPLVPARAPSPRRTPHRRRSRGPLRPAPLGRARLRRALLNPTTPQGASTPSTGAVQVVENPLMASVPPDAGWPRLLSLSVHEFRTPMTVVAGYIRM